jgi:hypothetical protein
MLAVFASGEAARFALTVMLPRLFHELGLFVEHEGSAAATEATARARAAAVNAFDAYIVKSGEWCKGRATWLNSRIAPDRIRHPVEWHAVFPMTS